MTVVCQVCQTAAHKPLFVKQGYEFVLCLACGHVFVAADFDRTEMLRIYATNFFADGGYADYLADEPLHRKNFSRYIPLLRQYSQGGRLFEIGCAYGFFLDLARRHWEVTGVDINEEAVRYGRERLGLDVIHRDLLEMDTKEEAYDVVAMWDTIEHLCHPADYVDRISRMLKPGGVLALTTGDVGSTMARFRGRRWRLYYPPEHLHYFSRATIRQLLARFGLEVVQIATVGFHRSINMMLYRMFFDRRPAPLRAIYRFAKWSGAARWSVYMNLFDIVLVVARKPDRP